MIRFWDKQFVESKDIEIAIASYHIEFGKNTWDDGKEYFRHNLCKDVAKVQLLPVNDEHDCVCYAYQDSEANRELRMLKELENHEDVLQFRDIYPEIRDVIVCGCNELAYRLVRYLEKQLVNVWVTGRYWERFGYEKTADINLDGAGKLVIYAEGGRPGRDDLYQAVMSSVSPEFECIDRIYEANVLEGKLKDTDCDFEQIVKKLKGKEIAILGTGIRSQDAYDFLYKHNIDISCFVVQNMRTVSGTLLGKKIVGIEEAICKGENFIFISSIEQNSALGTETVDFFDYYGFERNERFFLIRDYAVIKYSNLIHVLKGRTVRLAGDRQLCAILADYLNEIEQGDVDVDYIEISKFSTLKETDILCIVNLWLWFGGEKSATMNPKLWAFQEALSEQDGVSYTEYFSHTHAFVMIDSYRNRGREKYSIKQLTPKGILLGRIPGRSGNVFFRDILDGHPDILKWDYTSLNDNLFGCCIRLAEEKADNVLTAFKNICNEELSFRICNEFVCLDRFEACVGRMLSLKERFTSQELFVMFHLAWAEMLCGEQITDLNRKVIYWEPHHCPRDEFPFMAKWLESDQINGQTIFMHRDNIVKCGAHCKAGTLKAIWGENPAVTDDDTYRHWEEFQIRFEDIKLHPKTELTKICERLEIPWSDTMLRTTKNGDASDWEGIQDFDLKPVFNKYEECLSAFDRFRIALISSPYQKKYGYTYENCMQFSRRELQEMFLKEFRYQGKLHFKQDKDRSAYYIIHYKTLRQQLWTVRRHMLLDDIRPEFGEVKIGEARIKDDKGRDIKIREAWENLVQFVRRQKKLILYGLGRDCKYILDHLTDAEQSEFLFSDSKAVSMQMTFREKAVLDPRKLCDEYLDYKIFITSSAYYKTIQSYLESLGISSDRIACNTFSFGEEKK